MVRKTNSKNIMKIDPLEPKDDWLADEYWGPNMDEPEEDEDEDEDES